MVGNTYRNTFTESKLIVDQKCPVCGKNFIPAPYHYWKVKLSNEKWANTCSYSCMRVAEKENEKAELEKQEKKRLEKEQKKKEKKKK